MAELSRVERDVVEGERQLAEQEALLVDLKRQNLDQREAWAVLEMMRENQLRRDQDRQRLLCCLSEQRGNRGTQLAIKRAALTTERLPTPPNESSGIAPGGVGADIQKKSTIKHAAGSALFACLLALGGFFTIAWAITLIWGALSLVRWIVG
jgi:hypothetical protein